MKKLLIGFCGKAGSGKDTAAEHLAMKHGLKIESFGEPLKKMAQSLFDDLGIPVKYLRGSLEDKNTVIPEFSSFQSRINGRYFLQTLGTEWGREMIHQDIWLFKAKNNWEAIKNDSNRVGMVISDVRFDNEAEWIKSEGGIVIDIVNLKDPNMSNHGDHISESGISESLIDYRINNNKQSFGSFHMAIDNTVYNYIYGAPKVVEAVEDENLKSASCKNSIDNNESAKRMIIEWANKMFPDRTIKNAIDKMVLEEIPEFMKNQTDSMELADIGILLYDIAYLAGIDLDMAIKRKMIINMERKWGLDEKTGVYKHIKQQELEGN